MREMINQMIKKYEVRNANNREKRGEGEFVATTGKLERVGVGLAEIGEK
jgi:hypothetical protein